MNGLMCALACVWCCACLQHLHVAVGTQTYSDHCQTMLPLSTRACCRHFPRYQFMEESLRTGLQPELANKLVTPVLQTFAGVSSCGGA